MGGKGVNAKSRGGVKEFSVEVLLFHRLAGPWSEAPLYSEEHTELKVCWSFHALLLPAAGNGRCFITMMKTALLSAQHQAISI